MDEGQWEASMERLQAALDDGVFDEGTAQTLNYLQNLGNESDAGNQENVLASIKALCKGKPGSPFGRRGKPPALPPSVLAVVDEVEVIVANAATDYFASNSVIQVVTKKHGRSKGSPYYESAEAFGRAQGKASRKTLTAAYKENWDGTHDGLSDLILFTNDEEE
jgi:hypothetical protein